MKNFEVNTEREIFIRYGGIPKVIEDIWEIGRYINPISFVRRYQVAFLDEARLV